MQRRDFLTIAAAAAATSLARHSHAREPIVRTGAHRFNVGLAAYSLRGYFRFMKGKPQEPDTAGDPIDMIGFLDYCVANGFNSAELTSYFLRPDPSNAYLRSIKHAAFVRGVTISGTAIGNNFTLGEGPKLDEQIAAAETWIDRAAVMGAPHIRFFAGTAKQLAGNPERLIQATDAINHCAKRAARKGIFLGVENHGNLTADQMIEIMDKIDSPWVGINLDTGNFQSDDPYADIARCAPYAVNVQVKVSMKNAEGKKYPADLKRIGKILRESGYQGFVILEYEDENPYQAIPAAFAELNEALA